jgi:hypothetical protein
MRCFRVGCIRSLDSREMITFWLETVLSLRSFRAVRAVCPLTFARAVESAEERWREIPLRSAAAEVPARRSRQICRIELIHPVHAGEPEHLRRDDPKDRVRRRAGGWGVLTVDLVPLGLKWPAAGAESMAPSRGPSTGHLH